MSKEIVVAEPTGEGCSRSGNNSHNRREYTSRNARPFTRSITWGRDDPEPEPFDSEKLPVSLVSEIQMFLRISNLIETEEPRVAYLCRFHAFEVAHNLDRNSNGRGVRQFKTSLLQRLEQDEELTILRRKEKSDLRELKRVYHEYEDYIIKHGADCNPRNRQYTLSLNHGVEKLIKARAIASVLVEVLDTVYKVAGSKALVDRDSINDKSALFVPYNILPLDQGGVHQPIMQLPEIKAAADAIHNIHHLPFVEDFQKQVACMDLFDWLQFCFGFQKGNVANQREHLMLLLANIHVRESAKKTNMSKMAYELHGMLIGAVSMTTGEKVMPAYGGGSESFLNNIVTPIYKVILEEAMKSKNGTADYSTWRNYDDLNEYFWSPDCFEIGWPLRLDHNFFFVQKLTDPKVRKGQRSVKDIQEKKNGQNLAEPIEAMTDGEKVHKWLGKTNFVEVRSFWQIFRSFDRMWSFLILSLQAMIIMASHELESPFQVFDAPILEDVMSIFITLAILKLIQAILDIAFTWKASCSMDSSQILKHGLKVVAAVIWIIVLPWADTLRRQISVYVLFCLGGLRYTVFWVLLLLSKFSFSYNFEIKPLIAPTRQIMKIGVKNYDWHELFPKVQSNAGAITAIWAPIILIRTLGMLRSRFQSLPSAFNTCLVPPPSNKGKKRSRLFRQRFLKASETEKNSIVKFVLVWNQIISSFREEDLISNREMDLMKIPVSSELFSGVVRWPVFLLANKFTTALSIARDFVGKDKNLYRQIRKDNDMYCAVKECYESLKYVLEMLVVGDLERRVITELIDEIEEIIGRSSLLENFKMSELPALQATCIELVELLVEGNEDHHSKVVKALQDMFELVTDNMMLNGSRVLDSLHSEQEIEDDEIEFFSHIEPQLFASKDSIHFPLPDSGLLNERVILFTDLHAISLLDFKLQIKRFLLLLTVKDTAMDLPSNLEARRRISFFATSLYMNIPCAPKVRNMLSFSVLTPHFMEEVKFSAKELHSSQEEVSISFYMQKIYPDEWKNFLERIGRIGRKNSEGLDVEINDEDLRNWASFRGQTLSRTVRGMMYYKKALKLQAFLDMAEDEDILERYEAIERGNDTLSAQLDALADMKFTYVISCQRFGSHKAAGDPLAQDILDLMIRYPSLRVAYVEEKEDIVANKPRPQKVYSSILVKAVNRFDQEIYRIKLPGPPNIGEGKPENQNHAIIFTRGEALQAIDMNQDNYMEEALKVRNVLQEFLKHHGKRPPTILGLREHIFTGSVSSLAWFMSYQETSFVTIGQRLLANPLRVRFHYGHPDFFDRVFHLTRGGISKASKTINLSEDVFAGFNSTLRRGYITYQEYIQVGKGRDANSAVYEVAVYFLSLQISIVAIYIFLYGQLYLVLSGLEKALLLEARMHNLPSLETALGSQSFIQLGLLTGLPMVMEIGLERGFLNAIKDFVLMQLQLAAVFFTFSLGTKAHHYGRTILHGGAKYRPTGRKVVVFHASFTENYRLYSRSHFVKGFELLLLLVVYDLFRRSYQNNMAYVLITYSIWFMSLTWLFAPFLFNPSGFHWGKIVDDWKEWNKWIKQQGGIGIQQDKSWQSWWNDEQAHLRHSGLGSRLIEILLSLRFFIYQYGLVYHLDISGTSKNFIVYVLSWVVIVAIFLLVKAVNIGRQLLSANYHLAFRLFKAFLFIGVLATIIVLSRICELSLKDLIVCCLAFCPTGWGLILVSQAVRPKIEETGLWDFTQVFAQAYDYGMGVVLFTPIVSLAWLPIVSAFQTRFLFNEAFSRRLQIQQILAGKTKKT
ncbi:hypothetical protein RHMOL_Rhmol04G0054100 [Rhododendron molle]|uniref:Uncharacterized protein n=1 Tax=Rhododendron molle TaxID=49168 RepID=A0ACC0NYL6_RHOML|nr:hypothetical protein RHMOL_Rhmol04G0054100 [Rhododendron molle]